MRTAKLISTKPLLLGACVICWAVSSLLGADRTVAIQGGDLYTITSGVIRDGVILIDNGRISAIGQHLEIPRNARVIDARGKVVMPGLVAATAYGVADSRASGKIGESLDPFHQNLSLALASGITCMYTTSRGTNAVIKPTVADLDAMLVREPAVINVDFGAGQWVSRNDLKQNLRKAREYLRKLDAYRQAKDKSNLAEPRKPSGADQYIRLLNHEMPARLRATTTAEILSVLELVDEFDIEIIIEGAIEAWTVAEQIAKRDVRLIIAPRDKRRPNDYISTPSGSTLKNAAVLDKAGVKFAIVPTSPSFTTWGIAGRDLMALPMEAAFAVSGGLDEHTALETITIHAAGILGVADRLGSLQPGKDADIIILDGHPFHYKTFVQTTIIAGKVLYEKDKSTYFSHIK